MSGIYIHIPFCHKRCVYCDFFLVTNPNLIEKFIKALYQEIEISAHASKDSTFDTIYFGGGTPSALSPQQIIDIIKVVKKNFTVTEDAEITIEANPEDLNSANIYEYRNAGVNRLSLGVQSFSDTELKFLTREHKAEDAVEVVEEVKKSFDNYSIDIIYSLPQQTTKDINYSLQKAIGLGVPHISAYALTFEKRTVLHKQMEKGIAKQNSEETESEMYIFVSDTLSNAGYKHYEISSFTKPGYESRHNGKYWVLKNYLGLGPSSHSFFNGKRWNNVKSIEEYSTILGEDKLPKENEAKPDKDELLFEYVMTSLRSGGIELKKFSELSGNDFHETKKEAVKILVDSKFAEINDERFALTRKGFSIADEIIAKYF